MCAQHSESVLTQLHQNIEPWCTVRRSFQSTNTPDLVWEVVSISGWLTMKRTTFEYCAFGLLSNPSDEADKPYWSDDALDTMDRAFRERMLDAIDAGLECCPKRVNTTPGTRHPIINYRRPD